MDQIAYAKRVAVIGRLEDVGHELRRPTADVLRNGIYELRAKRGHVNYRLLYFFHGRHVAILAHALTKEDVAPPADIERALRRKLAFEANLRGTPTRSEHHGREGQTKEDERRRQDPRPPHRR
jgi:phage-related protein